MKNPNPRKNRGRSSASRPTGVFSPPSSLLSCGKRPHRRHAGHRKSRDMGSGSKHKREPWAPAKNTTEAPLDGVARGSGRTRAPARGTTVMPPSSVSCRFAMVLSAASCCVRDREGRGAAVATAVKRKAGFDPERNSQTLTLTKSPNQRKERSKRRDLPGPSSTLLAPPECGKNDPSGTTTC
jgi:hypothetical protein